MNYLTLEDIKRQCIIDFDFTDDDIYLESLGNTAEDFVEQIGNLDLSDIVGCKGELPPSLKHSMLLLCEYFYNNRGSDTTDIPPLFYTMIKMYRNY